MDKKESIEYLDQILDMTLINIKAIISKEKYAETISPFIHIINHWNRIFGLLIYNCYNDNIKKILVLNLFEGYKHDKTKTEAFYEYILFCGYAGITYSDKLSRIGICSVIEEHMEQLNTFVHYYDFYDSCQIFGAIKYIFCKMLKKFDDYYFESGSRHYFIENYIDGVDTINMLFENPNMLINKKMLDNGSSWAIGLFRELLTV